MKDYFFILIIVVLAVFFIVKEIRNDNVERITKNANKQLQLKYDSLTVKINDLQKLIMQLDSVKTVNNNYYTEVIKESNEIIKADSNNANGLFRNALQQLSNNN